MVIAVIPAYNEEKTIGSVLTKVQKYVDKIIVIDDGSTDRTGEIAGQYHACVLRHLLNRGLGAALRTGFVAALKENVDIVVTLDADGQHNAEDIPRLIEPIQSGRADVVIGSRFIREKQNIRHFDLDAKSGEESRGSVATHEMSAARPSGSREIPLFRKVANRLGNLITFIFFGIWVSDSQSGFRAFSRSALERINLKSSGMEVSSEITKEIKKNNLRFIEVPIKPVYTPYSLSKGQNFLEGIKTVFQLILRRIE